MFQRNLFKRNQHFQRMESITFSLSYLEMISNWGVKVSRKNNKISLQGRCSPLTGFRGIAPTMNYDTAAISGESRCVVTNDAIVSPTRFLSIQQIYLIQQVVKELSRARTRSTIVRAGIIFL